MEHPFKLAIDTAEFIRRPFSRSPSWYRVYTQSKRLFFAILYWF